MKSPTTNVPGKEIIRRWRHTEVTQHRPPPSPEAIRRQLGWDLVAAERKH